jgi:hypothetical protein
MHHRRGPRSRPRTAIAFLLRMLALLASAPAAAQRRSSVPNKPELGSLGERINANTVAAMPGNPNATYVTIAYDDRRSGGELPLSGGKEGCNECSNSEPDR